MDLSLISEQSWTDFAALYPQAAQLLLHASLEGERTSLRRAVTYDRATTWQQQRLQELECCYTTPTLCQQPAQQPITP